MQPLQQHIGRVAALPRPNVDTDQIIPKQFLKRITRTGFGPAAFFDWRYRADGTPDPAFELNRPEAAGASILLAGANFGCGSSREHAPWALGEYGFRVIVAESFADIFAQNCVQNGMLPATASAATMAELFARAVPGPYRLTVDLVACELRDEGGLRAPFTISEYRREMLLAGLDEIGRTLTHADAIAAWERQRTPELAGDA